MKHQKIVRIDGKVVAKTTLVFEFLHTLDRLKVCPYRSSRYKKLKKVVGIYWT